VDAGKTAKNDNKLLSLASDKKLRSNVKLTCSVYFVWKVMVFVHARNETVRTASVLCEIAKNNGQNLMFAADKSVRLAEALKQVHFWHLACCCILLLLLKILIQIQ